MKPRSDSRISLWKPLGAALALSLLFHLLGAVLFRATAVPDKPALPPPPLVTFLSPTDEASSSVIFRERIEQNDPSVSSLPNPAGFSRTTIHRNRQVPSLIEARQDNPQFLPRAQTDPAQRILVTAPTLANQLGVHGQKQTVEPEQIDFEAIITNRRVESSYVLGGAIRERPLLSLPSVPLVRVPAPPHPSVVRIAVSPLGEVKFAVLERSSGADDKDARALDIVRRWRFKAVPENTGDQWGTVSIYWQAEPAPAPSPAPAETNALPTQPATPSQPQP